MTNDPYRRMAQALRIWLPVMVINASSHLLALWWGMAICFAGVLWLLRYAIQQHRWLSETIDQAEKSARRKEDK